MRILFIHQNFPGQFKALAPALAQRGHHVWAMTMQQNTPPTWCGIRMVPYRPDHGSTPNIHPWIIDFETKAIRAEACFRAALKMKESGFTPEVIIAHPGWGESLFIKDIWPDARLGIYCEFFYHLHGADVGFDPEFPSTDPTEVCRLRFKNLTNIMQFESADAGISPTYWQASTFPIPFRHKISVVHDGIDTDAIAPNPNAQLLVNGSTILDKNSEVITFVNRNLEPYRGYHIFMRALPEILRLRPHARVLIVGGDNVSYGTHPGNGTTWKEIFASEIRPAITDSQWSRVYFLGNIPYNHFITLMQISTIHVYLTYPFVLSWSMLEAMAAGCTIVASDTTPVHEVIHHDISGRLVNFFDIETLSREICTLLEDKSTRQRLSDNARDFAIKNYDLKTSCLPRQLLWVDNLINM